VIVVAVFAVLQVGLSYLHFRVPRLRPLLEGSPLVVIEDGKPIEKNLRRERLTVIELQEQARLHDIPSLDQVQWAVLETNGAISFLKKDS